MSSETSTREVRPTPDHTSDGLHPWQFFVLAALGCATAVTFIARGQGATTVILLGVLMATAALIGMAVLRTVRPLVSNEEDRTAMIGQRTRVALEREKALSLKSIKELEFDRAMGRLSDSDWKEMSGRLRARAARIIRQLDAGSGYRDQIERDLATRIGEKQDDARSAKGEDTRSAKALAERFCTQCGTANDTDARFCKSCGHKL
jgi:zinc ribbon protein